MLYRFLVCPQRTWVGFQGAHPDAMLTDWISMPEDLGAEGPPYFPETTLGDGAYYELQNSSSLPRILGRIFLYQVVRLSHISLD